jgi:hypothetical protein
MLKNAETHAGPMLRPPLSFSGIFRMLAIATIAY